jgi:hypothetical protein
MTTAAVGVTLDLGKLIGNEMEPEINSGDFPIHYKNFVGEESK